MNYSIVADSTLISDAELRDSLNTRLSPTTSATRLIHSKYTSKRNGLVEAIHVEAGHYTGHPADRLPSGAIPK
jgi:hypothetical protein